MVVQFSSTKLSKNPGKHAFTYFSRSEVGNKRSDNQDNYCIIDRGNWLLLAVCDGMGGARGGDIASELGIDSLIKNFSKSEKAPSQEDLNKAIQSANKRIFHYGQNDKSKKGLGTTISILVCDETGYRTAHIGDSRIFIIRGDKVTQITTDHTWANEVISTIGVDQLRPESSPMSHMLTRSLGVTESLQVDLTESSDLRRGDVFLLSSDGLHNYCNADVIGSLFKKANVQDLSESFTDLLFRHALEQEGADNLTAVFLQINLEKKEIGRSEPHANIKVGRKLSITDNLESADSEFNLNKYFDQISSDLADRNIAMNPSFSANISGLTSVFYFIYGALFATLIGFFVWIIRPDLPPEGPRDVSGNSKMQSMLLENKGILNLQDQETKYDGRFPIPLKNLYEYIKDKDRQINYPDKINPTLIKSKSQEVLQPNRPIVWENEEHRIQVIKQGFTTASLVKSQNEDVGSKIPDQQLSSSKNAYVFQEKSLIREQLFDQSEKLKQLNFISKDQALSYQKDLVVLENEIKLEHKKIYDLESETLKKETGLHSLRKLLSAGDNNSLEMLAARLTAYDDTYEALGRRIDLLKDTQDYYADLVRKISNPESVLLKLGSSQHELEGAYRDLRSDLERTITQIENDFVAYVAGLRYVKDLLRIERQRLQRAQGFAQVFIPVTDERREAMFNLILSERSKLIEKYFELEAEVSYEVEAQREIRRLINELKLL